jgi:trypsin-like peptidase
MKSIAFVIFASLLATPSAYPAQNSVGIGSEQLPRKDETSQFRPNEVVVKIGKRYIDPKESLKRVGLAIVSNNGTGYCFGQGKCDFILTNYHVAERVRSPLEVNGVKVLQTYEATNSQDKDAVWEKSRQGFSVKLVPVRDIAIFRMQHPLKGMHGIPFSARELRERESVRIYGHPYGGRLTMAEASFYGEAKDGLLFFKVKAGEENVLVPGISGSLVVNEKNEAVGLVQGIANGNMAKVVPVWSIADFAKTVWPNSYPEIFSFPDGGALYRPDNSELVPVDLIAESEALAKDIGPEVGMSPPPALPEEYLWHDLDKPIPPLAPGIVSKGSTHVRAAEPHNVQALRISAEDMVESINDLIAVGTERSFGGKTPEVTAQYQLRMVAGRQTFTMDGKETHQRPCPNGNGFGLSTAWADFPTMVGNDLKLSIQQVDDLTLQGWGSVKVFRYEGTAEDKVAKIGYCTDYGLGIHTVKLISVPVRGEVWTDDALNILRITQELLAPPSMGWLNMRSSVLYGWLESPKGERKLVPTNMIGRAELTDDHQIYSTLCRITDYHRFTVSAVIGDQIPRPII